MLYVSEDFINFSVVLIDLQDFLEHRLTLEIVQTFHDDFYSENPLGFEHNLFLPQEQEESSVELPILAQVSSPLYLESIKYEPGTSFKIFPKSNKGKRKRGRERLKKPNEVKSKDFLSSNQENKLEFSAEKKLVPIEEFLTRSNLKGFKNHLKDHAFNIKQLRHENISNEFLKENQLALKKPRKKENGFIRLISMQFIDMISQKLEGIRIKQIGAEVYQKFHSLNPKSELNPKDKIFANIRRRIYETAMVMDALKIIKKSKQKGEKVKYNEDYLNTYPCLPIQEKKVILESFTQFKKYQLIISAQQLYTQIKQTFPHMKNFMFSAENFALILNGKRNEIQIMEKTKIGLNSIGVYHLKEEERNFEEILCKEKKIETSLGLRTKRKHFPRSKQFKSKSDYDEGEMNKNRQKTENLNEKKRKESILTFEWVKNI